EEQALFSVIFEVLPAPQLVNEYLGLAKRLRPILETMDGFIDNERFESQRRPGWILSHSTWRDEKSVVRWRTVGEHHAIQEHGRQEVLSDYHLRVGDVTTDTAGPVHQQRYDTTEIGTAKVVTLTEITPRPAGALPGVVELPEALGVDPRDAAVVDHDTFASIYNPGKLALLVSWTDAEASSRWTPRASREISDLRHRAVRVVRDYGKFDRREAPQYYPDASGRETVHAQPAH
ncbi:MAG: antibiotic biosynthesis monooxygenase family protein, partial [Solirubrobacteraceae bacterium]